MAVAARQIDEGRKKVCKATLSLSLLLQTARGGLHGRDLCGSSDIWRADCTDHGKTFISKDVP